MDKRLYAELISNINEYASKGDFDGCAIYVFAHCEASLTIIDEMRNRGFFIEAILDNSAAKQGLLYKDVQVVAPGEVMAHNRENTVVLLASRFYEQMNDQLKNLGFKGRVIRLVDYNSYAEYSLSQDTIGRKRERLRKGAELLGQIKERHHGAFAVLCPFNALGDIYFCMSYLPAFLAVRDIRDYVVVVPSVSCQRVAELFGVDAIEVIGQKELDGVIQAVIHDEDSGAFIAHQDRPYIINLHRALYKKKISLDEIYKYGVFGLPGDVAPVLPKHWIESGEYVDIPRGKSAILSPYAKSVTPIPSAVWKDIVADLLDKGYRVYTNVCGDEDALAGTAPISPRLAELKGLAERAGLFIGIRSGLCDILRTADCRKIALYPDYYYGDTRWKAIDMYALDGFENIVVGEDYRWQMN